MNNTRQIDAIQDSVREIYGITELSEFHKTDFILREVAGFVCEEVTVDDDFINELNTREADSLENLNEAVELANQIDVYIFSGLSKRLFQASGYAAMISGEGLHTITRPAETRFLSSVNANMAVVNALAGFHRLRQAEVYKDEVPVTDGKAGFLGLAGNQYSNSGADNYDIREFLKRRAEKTKGVLRISDHKLDEHAVNEYRDALIRLFNGEAKKLYIADDLIDSIAAENRSRSSVGR